MIAVEEDIADTRNILDLAAVGLYPTHLDLEQAAEMEAFIRQNRTHLAAIGEVRVDY